MHTTRRLALAAALIPAVAVAQPPAPPTDAFVSLTATGDTFAVERYARTRDHIAGEIVVHAAHQRLSYTLLLGDSDLVTRLDASVRADTASPTSTPRQQFSASFVGDSIRVQLPDGSTHTAAAARGSLPWINPSFVLIEQLLRRAHRLDPARAREVSVPMFDLSGGPIAVAVTWAPADSAGVRFPNAAVRVAIDRTTDHVLGARLSDGSLTRARHL